VGAPVLSAANWVRLCVQGLVMTVGTLAVYPLAEDEFGAATANTMLLTTLSLFHLAAGYMARDQRNTIFDRDTLPGATQLRRYGFALLAIIAITTIPFLQRIAGTVDLTFAQWSICVGIASSIVVVEELIKLVLRRREREPSAAVPVRPAWAV
jgi:Ca2+-transporting ATPase